MLDDDTEKQQYDGGVASYFSMHLTSVQGRICWCNESEVSSHLWRTKVTKLQLTQAQQSQIKCKHENYTSEKYQATQVPLFVWHIPWLFKVLVSVYCQQMNRRSAPCIWWVRRNHIQKCWSGCASIAPIIITLARQLTTNAGTTNAVQDSCWQDLSDLTKQVRKYETIQFVSKLVRGFQLYWSQLFSDTKSLKCAWHIIVCSICNFQDKLDSVQTI